MTFLCRLAGHSAGTVHHRNQGLDFAVCHHCGCDLIRAEESDWIEVPRGFRVVWREFGRSDDAASVAVRMQRIAPPRAPPGPARRRSRTRAATGAGARCGRRRARSGCSPGSAS
jgi:hypothetical protein